MVIQIKYIAGDGKYRIGGWEEKEDKISETLWKAVRGWYAIDY